MSSSLGPLLTNTIMCKRESEISKHLLSDSFTKFYCCYADGTLLVLRPVDVSHVYNLLSQFHNNLCLTGDLFQNETPHFLGREILRDSIYFFRKYALDCTLVLTVLCLVHTMSLGLEIWYLVHPLFFLFVCFCKTNYQQKSNIMKVFASENDFPRYMKPLK